MVTILIYYTAALGHGHKRAAEIIAEHWKKRFPQDKVILIDALKSILPGINQCVNYCYRFFLRYTPQWYAGQYYRTTKHFWGIRCVRAIYKRQLQKYQPTMIITTQAFPAVVLDTIPSKAKKVAVLTDYHVHQRWINDSFDVFCVPSQEVKEQLQKGGIEKKKIIITGIPIHEYAPKKTEEKTVLITGGGAGLLEFKKIIARVKKYHNNIVVMTGNNKKVQKQLQTEQVKVIGFVKNIEEYYQQAKIVITKPGGLTTTELVAMQKPMILVNPLPGQEEENTMYLVKKGVAVYARTEKELETYVHELLTNKKKWKEMKKRGESLGNRKAADTIVQALSAFR